uniref:PH domain-containing protein n=1 Tax=Panagrolaimus sp. ES5 TaxID=591445 RepID=A0AC34G610_9BILA
MKSLYLKIKSVKGDNEKWIKALMEAEDQQFVEDNVEHQLGQDLTNKKLWKLYLEYLNLNNQKKLLQTYSKYCRFFITDADMLEEYRKTAVGSQQKVFVPWKNPFNFEEFDENFFAEEILPNKLFPVFQKPPLKHHFNPKNALPQRFPFKPTLMHYILKTADANILQNLFKSCKYFYLSNPVTIIFKLKPYHGPANGIQIREQSINLQICSTIPAWLGKLFISTILDLSSNMFNNFLPRLYRCTAKYVSLSQLNLSDKEMDILIGHGNVVDLHLWEIKDENDKFLILENVLKMVPKIINLVVNCVRCTTKTAEILCQLPFKNKMENFGLTDVQDTALEPKDFAKFITKNFCSKGEAIFEFSYFDGRAAYSKNFREAVNAGIDESWNGKESDKPTFKFT